MGPAEELLKFGVTGPASSLRGGLASPEFNMESKFSDSSLQGTPFFCFDTM